MWMGTVTGSSHPQPIFLLYTVCWFGGTVRHWRKNEYSVTFYRMWLYTGPSLYFVLNGGKGKLGCHILFAFIFSRAI